MQLTMSLSLLCFCLASSLLGRVQAYPSNSFQKSEELSSWFDLFAPDGSIKTEELEKFPLYEYGFEDYEYGDQIWSDCSDSSYYAVQINSVYINPSPPQRGGSFTVSSILTLSEKISSGYVKILIKYRNFIPVVSKTLKLCNMVEYLGISCPISAGTQTFSTTNSFPSYAPSGRYVGKVTAYNSSGSPYLCVAIDMTLS